MKVIDAIGNSLVKGRLLLWKPHDIYVKVMDVVSPSIGIPGKVVISVEFGIAPIEKGKDVENGAVNFKDFITVNDPEEEIRTTRVLEGVSHGIQSK
jgi:hypothetical protein